MRGDLESILGCQAPCCIPLARSIWTLTTSGQSVFETADVTLDCPYSHPNKAPYRSPRREGTHTASAIAFIAPALVPVIASMSSLPPLSNSDRAPDKRAV